LGFFLFLLFDCTSHSMIAFLLIKIKSYLSMTSSCSAAGAIILILFSSILTNVAYAQIFPNTQGNTTATPAPIPLSTLQQQQPPSQPKLHLVKITSPAKGQHVPIGKDLTISGTSLDNVTSSDCKVSVKVNAINPYHNASGNGGPGQAEYSKWNFTLTSAYTNIQPGPNKITAKFSCGNNPILLSHNSVNVTGVAATDVSATNNNSSQQEQISSTVTSPVATEGFDSATANSTSATSPISSGAKLYTNVNNTNYDNNIKPLSVSVHLGKNSPHPGDKQTITLSVADKNSTAAISGASVSGKITGPSGALKKVEGTTDDNGKASYSWKVHNDYATGKYKVRIEVSALGYENYSGSKTFKVTPIPVTVSHDNSITSNSDSSSTLPIPIANDKVIRSASPVTIPDNIASTSDNPNSHHHKHHILSSNMISSASPVPIPTDQVFPSNSENTNTNTPNIDQYSSSIRGDMNSNSLSSSLESNVGKNVGGLAQKIINDVKNKLEMQGIHFP